MTLSKRARLALIAGAGGILLFLLIFFLTREDNPPAPSRVTMAAPQYSNGSLDWLEPLVDHFSPSGTEPYGVLKQIPEGEYSQYLKERIGQPATEDLFYSVNGRHLRLLKEAGTLSPIPQLETAIPPGFRNFLHLEGQGAYQPLTWYYWGLYYNKEQLSSWGIDSIPSDWEDFLALCAQLKEKGIAPLVIPRSDLWAGALWFDYLDCRINGPDFHLALLEGDQSWKDPRVLNVLETLRELQPYLDEIPSQSRWEQALARVAEGDAAFILMGRFAESYWSKSFASEPGWAPFPRYSEDVVPVEFISSAGLVFSSQAFNREEARLFLDYLSRRESIEIILQGSDNLPVATEEWWLGRQGVARDAWDQANKADALLPVMDRNTHPELLIPIKLALGKVLFTKEDLNQIVQELEDSRSTLDK